MNRGEAMVIAAAARLNARVAGMTAANMERQRRGEAMAYTEQAFIDVIGEEGCDWNSMVTNLNDNG